MKKLSANVCAVTHAGRVRKDNEDNYSLNGRLTSTGELKKGSAFVQKMAEPFHLVVCDGMGGESYGEVASGIAAETMSKHAADIYNSGEDFNFAISSFLDEANTKICNEINSRGKRMGTTLAGIYATKGKVICVSIGDTRIYHFANGILEQMSFDHTHAQQFIDARAASYENMENMPGAKSLTKHLGTFPEEGPLEPNVSVIDDVNNGDVIMLCSDGLTDMLTDDEISAIISSGETPQDVTGKLIRKALEKGGKDNITVVTAFMSAEDSAIFVPIAEAMVGDKGADYEEEYRTSYGKNSAYEDESYDPYANADSFAGESDLDKGKIIKIAVIVLVVLAVLAAAAFIIKAVMDKRKERNTTTTQSEYYYDYSSTSEISTWFTSTETTSEEESSSEEESTEDITVTTQPTATVAPTRRYYPSTTRPRTTAKPSTTGSTAPTSGSTTGTTAPSTALGSTTDNSTASTAPGSTTDNSTASTAPGSTTENPGGVTLPTVPSSTNPTQPTQPTQSTTQNLEQALQGLQGLINNLGNTTTTKAAS